MIETNNHPHLETNYHQHIETETNYHHWHYQYAQCSSLILARAHLVDSIGTAKGTAPGRPCKVSKSINLTQLKFIFKFDEDGNGTIEFAEFLVMISSKWQGHPS